MSTETIVTLRRLLADLERQLSGRRKMIALYDQQLGGSLLSSERLDLETRREREIKFIEPTEATIAGLRAEIARLEKSIAKGVGHE